jgi:hypothetical protein
MANWKITTGYTITAEMEAGLPTYYNEIFTIPSALLKRT